MIILNFLFAFSLLFAILMVALRMLEIKKGRPTILRGFSKRCDPAIEAHKGDLKKNLLFLGRTKFVSRSVKTAKDVWSSVEKTLKELIVESKKFFIALNRERRISRDHRTVSFFLRDVAGHKDQLHTR